MTSDQLAVERAAWAVALKMEFKHSGFNHREHLNDFQTLFVVTHAASPGWKANVTLCSAHQRRNRVEINGLLAAHGCKTAVRHKIMKVLTVLRVEHDRQMVRTKTRESSAAQWIDRQHKELEGLEELKGMDIEIITRGVHEGQYRVTWQPGNALENLTLEQVRKLHQFLKALFV